MCNIILSLEIREHILRFSSDNFSNVVGSVLGGDDVYHNYYSILERLIYKRRKVDVFSSNVAFKLLLPGNIIHNDIYIYCILCII